MRLLRPLVILALLAAAGLYGWTRPDPLPQNAMAGYSGDATRGQRVFLAAGCAGCHMAEEASGAEQLVLSGGQAFPSDFGTFHAPNISSDREHGIGDWSALDLANALTRGVSRSGAHLYPALPYAAYAHMTLQDVADLHSYLQTLPASTTPSQPHALSFPFNQRMLLGGWKMLFMGRDWVVTGDLTATETRGRYLVEALSHCAECHTPRNALGGLQTGKWLAGAPNPSGQGQIPNITPGALDWGADDIATYLTTGFTPDYDSVGGHMAHVVAAYAQLPPEDAQAVAAYLKRVPPQP